MKKLIITAHPSKDSYTHKIANKLKTDNAEIIDLYDKKNYLNYLTFETKEKEKITNFQQKILKSDEIIFIFPLWNLSEPAILKNFFDSVFSAKFAFKYENGKPKGLLKGKTAKIYITCDGSSLQYKLIGDPLKKIWKYGRINFCGIKLKKFKYIDKMRNKSENKLNLILNKL